MLGHLRENCYEAALHAGVIERARLEVVREELAAIQPGTAVFDQQYVRRLCGPHVKAGQNKYALATQLMEDIETFQGRHGCQPHGDALVWQHGSLHGTR